MAIVVEEERNSGGGVVNILIWLVLLGIVGSAIYYVFIVNPQIVEMAMPAGFQNTQQLSKTIKPESVISGSNFQNLKKYVEVPEPGSVGRTNPFLPF
jgi:hypothetical protein